MGSQVPEPALREGERRAKVTQLCSAPCYVTDAALMPPGSLPTTPCLPPAASSGHSGSHHRPACSEHPSLPPCPAEPEFLQRASLAWPFPPSIPAPSQAGTARTSCSRCQRPARCRLLPTVTPVPEGPHGDAVLPHQAPHGASALHAWLGGGVSAPGPRPRPRPPEPGFLPTRGRLSSLAVRPLTSSQRGEGKGDPKARETVRQRPHGSCGSQPLSLLSQGSRRPLLQTLPTGGSHTPDCGFCTTSYPPPARRQRWLGQGNSESLGGTEQGRPPARPPHSQAAWGPGACPASKGGLGGERLSLSQRKVGGRRGRAHILPHFPRGLNPTPPPACPQPGPPAAQPGQRGCPPAGSWRTRRGEKRQRHNRGCFLGDSRPTGSPPVRAHCFQPGSEGA